MKLGGWMVMLLTFMIFLTLVGFPTMFSSILENFGIITDESGEIIQTDVETSTFWDRIFNDTTGWLVVLIGATVIIGLFARGYDPSLVYVPIIVFIAGTFIPTFWMVISYVQTYEMAWMTGIVTLIFGGLAIGFIMACVDYFGGR